MGGEYQMTEWQEEAIIEKFLRENPDCYLIEIEEDK